MRRFVIHLLALAGFAGFAGTALAAPMAQPVELVAPRSGETLVAGATAEIAWAPLASYAKLRGAEEWEAFLSLDGGATYPLRITPHLDQDLRRFSWQVPPVPTADARLLLRFGDERRETMVELPQRFSIAASPVAAAPTFLLEIQSPARGERARLDKDDDDEAGVVAWVEGSRRGGALRQVVAVAPPGFQTRIQPADTHEEAIELAGGHSLPVPELSATLGAVPQVPPGSRFAGPLDSHPFAFDILLLTQRRNE